MTRIFNLALAIPLIAIGALLLSFAYYSWAMICCPTKVTGKITRHERVYDVDGDFLFLHFEFPADTGIRKASSSVSQKRFYEWKDGTACPVIYTKLVPSGAGDLDVPERTNIGWIFTPFITFFAVMWNVLTYLFIWCRSPMQQERLPASAST